jgi:hypothetical protein
MVSEPVGVRPTKRCLGDLGVELPDLGVRLEEIDQPVIASAQAVPEQRDAGGAERIVALTDRVWFKVKTSDHRAAVTELRGTDLPDWVRPSRGAWWIGAAGRRQADSPQRDFYAMLQRECTTGKTVSSDRLLPADWDWKRLAAEQAVAWRREMKSMVIRLVAMSLKSGSLAVAEFRNTGSRPSSGQRTGTRPTSRSLPRECRTRRCSRCSSTASRVSRPGTGSLNRRPWRR